ncbi:GntR family transcriptional regulator [Streptomyces sp. JV176]|uniref:GntR family transcriptional regulator n=1 Tax=Streptomyces sp. JV176 TaxID=858630 RepID=UPI002E7914F9|nr:GntR family transcriptional regulator [Streptomyces sp. JV176]MEE1803434.1 GntR family transcriptional regulator [Streptomyces sp. JV176]
MEQGRARETTAPVAPAPRASEGVRVPEQARTDACEPVRGEHTHGERPAPPRGRTRTGTGSGAGSGSGSGSGAGGPAGNPGHSVRRHSVRGQILAALRDALVGGELVPGEVYSAPVLAERFGVSATPVREAMQQLALEGAVETVPNRGFRVTRRTPGEIAELAEVRALLEVPVMLRLARTVPAERWAEIRPLAEATGRSAALGDRAAYAECDRAFHRALLSLSGNQHLVAVADDVHRRSQWPPAGAPAVRRADLIAHAAEHLALLEALTAGDLPLVQSLVRAHSTGEWNTA